MRIVAASASTKCCNFARSTKVCEVTIVPIAAAVQPAAILAGPAVKLIIAGTRPEESMPSTASAAPLLLGGLAVGAALQLRVDTEAHRFERGHPDLRKPPAAHLLAVETRKHRRLRPLDAHRHDHRTRFLGDQGGAVIDLH